MRFRIPAYAEQYKPGSRLDTLSTIYGLMVLWKLEPDEVVDA